MYKSEEDREGHDDEFVPLRKKLKRKSTGKEDNFVRSYYSETLDISKLSEQEVDEIRWNQGIEVQGESCPKPIRTFSDLFLPSELQQYLKENNYFVPTPIQMQALSCVMSGRDVIGLAETGSGKTLAYSLPLCMMLRKRRPSTSGPIGLIVTPTRELMQQVYEHISGLLNKLKCADNFNLTAATTAYGNLRFPGNLQVTHEQYLMDTVRGCVPSEQLPELYRSSFSGSQPNIRTQSFVFSFSGSYPVTSVSLPNQQQTYKAVAVCGGVPISSQIQTLKGGVDVVIATPGRLLDLCERGILALGNILYLVMDEADKMLGMGMEEQLRKIVGLATSTMKARQSLLWSATMPVSLERLARSAVMNPITIQVGQSGLTAPSIHQNVLFMHHYEKPDRLLRTLRSTPFPPVIVFTSSIQNVDFVVGLLRKEQFHVAGLHSEKTQEYRFKLVSAFRNGKVDVLVGTDVASRGLDFPDVTHIVSYDLPDNIEDYVHRCGRTGRMGKEGMATSFLTLDCKIAEELKEMLETTEQSIPKELENTKQFGKKIIRTEFGDRVVDFQSSYST